MAKKNNRCCPLIKLLFIACMMKVSLAQDKTGCIEGDCRDGVGTYLYDYGAKYNGEFKEGKKHGTGTYWFDNGDTYEGEYANGMKHGSGIYIFKDGRKYVGMYKDGRRHGIGKFTDPDGRKYEGEYKNGKEDGQGWDLRLQSLDHRPESQRADLRAPDVCKV